MKRKILIGLFVLAGMIGCNQTRRSSMDLLTLDFEHLEQIRKGIRDRSPEFQVAYQRLLKEADIALSHHCSSVTQKEGIPPSGDKKDYMSLATYWWPDPDQPDGKPYVRKDGYRNPEGNGDYYDDRRSSRMVDDIFTLTLAWYYSDNLEYARKAAEMLQVWFLQPETAMNPSLDFAQGIPGIVPGRGVGIIDTRKYIYIIDAVKLLQMSKEWGRNDTKKLRLWFSVYADWLKHSENGLDEMARKNNHGSWYDVQLAYFCDFIGKPELTREVLLNSATRRINDQIDSLGQQPMELARTKSYRYSIMNLQALMYMGKMGDRYGIDLWNYQSPQDGNIRSACDFLFSYVPKFEKWPHQQISPIDWSKLIPLVSECCRNYNDPGYKALLQELKQNLQPTDRIIITKL